MHIPTTNTDFDIQIVCHAEVDLPVWLGQLTGKSGWKLYSEEESEMCEAYSFRRGEEEAQVVLFHSGHAIVDVGDHTLYDGSLLNDPGAATLNYFNAKSGEPILLN